MINGHGHCGLLAAAARLFAAFLLVFPLGGPSLLMTAGVLRDGEINTLRYLVEEEYKRTEAEPTSVRRSDRIVYLMPERCGATVEPWVQSAAAVEHVRIDHRNGAGFVIRC
jgi:hypothetical protein